MLSSFKEAVSWDGAANLQQASNSVSARSLTLGIIASEFPPEYGGMQEHALGLVENLARDHRILVYTSEGLGYETDNPNITMKPVMQWQAAFDLPRLRLEPVDAWITLNAGLAPYSLGLSAPVFAYVHGNDFSRPWHPFPSRSIRLMRKLSGGERLIGCWQARRISAGLRSSRWIFANSAFSRDLCIRLRGVSAERFSVVPPGVRTQFFQTTDPGTSKRLRLVTVSRLTNNSQRKNIDGVLQAVALLKGEIDIQYTVIGDGDDLARLRGLTVQLGIEASVRFLGAVDTAAVIAEFGRSDVFIMTVKPNNKDVEGFGMVYAEAAATGLPSIGTNIGGIPEVIENGVTGVLLDDVSPAGIADGLRRFLHQRHKFDRAKIRSRAERFSSPACTAMIAETITSLV